MKCKVGGLMHRRTENEVVDFKNDSTAVLFIGVADSRVKIMQEYDLRVGYNTSMKKS